MGKSNKSLTGRMMRWFLLVILIPMCLFAVLFFVITAKYSFDAAIDDSYAMLNVVSESIVSNAEMVENGIHSISFDEDLMKLLTGRQSDYEKIILQQEVKEHVLGRVLTLLAPLESRVTLYVSNERVPITYWQVMKTEDAEPTEDYQRFVASGETGSWVGKGEMYPEHLNWWAESNREMICYYHKVLSGTGECIGVLKCGVAPEKLFAVLDAQNAETPIHVQYNGEIIYGGAEDASAVDTSKLRQRIDGRLYLVKNIESVNIALVMSLDYKQILQQAMMSGLPTMLATVGSGLFLLLVTQLFLRGIHKRLNQAVAFAEQARDGHLDIRFPEPGGDEVGRLIASFNTLLEQLQEMAKRQIENERREKRALRLALQYQMNPHFLFNTLNWLHMSMEMHADREQLSEGIVHLGRLLRYNLNDGAFATLSEEIANTREYIRLMNMRKNNLIALDVDVDGLDGDWSVMRFVFQPLCENAIQHGMIPGQTLNIRISGAASCDGVCFTVENDGAMISEDRLKQLRAGIEREEGQNGVGLANIAARLRLLYGPKSNLTVTSETSKTCVKMFLQNRDTAG